ncbi:uncharacterized protein LOC141914028 [Tubulanus polymorphus]|uniref:uncharacterized protein LOC141914028 n=1 Tax=Tubulanus polymorphus TaxID=672921 RepID=UPI003DA218A5
MLKSEETSHVSSDEEDEQPKKRRRTRPVRWSDDESENSDSLMSQVPSRNSASYSHQKNVLPTPLPQRRPSMSNSLISAPVQPQRFPPMTPSSTSRENQSTPVQQQTRVPVRSLVGSSTDILIKGFEAIVKCANTIIDNQEEIISIMRNQVALRPDDNDDEDPINKPLNTQEEFAALEEKLVNNPEFRKKFTAWLLTIRGAEHNAKIRQIMRNIGTNKMWSSWSLYGKKGKFCICRYCCMQNHP